MDDRTFLNLLIGGGITGVIIIIGGVLWLLRGVT